MQKNKQCFVKTKDIEVKKALEEQGFEYIGFENGLYVFLNNGGNIETFENVQMIKTNLLSF